MTRHWKSKEIQRMSSGSTVAPSRGEIFLVDLLISSNGSPRDKLLDVVCQGIISTRIQWFHSSTVHAIHSTKARRFLIQLCRDNRRTRYTVPLKLHALMLYYGH
ncbi:hypothetical protein J6590_080971 [Homalodisca vitripennis]|nr:hypothetical protein J6590_080971 [Homalodisca vitripennis]